MTPGPTLRIGCPMWAHPPWVGRYLRSSTTALADYATWCNAVEGNTTFYAEPSARTVARWAEQAPADFRFVFKVPRTVSHERRLQPSAHREVASFLRALRPLDGRIGPLLLQLPPSFGPDSLAVLARFVSGLPTSHRWVVELRHPGFFDGGDIHRATDEVLGEADVGRVVLDTRPLYAAPADSEAGRQERRTKPRLPVVVEAMGPQPVVRVIGGDDLHVTSEGVEQWIPTAVDWLGEGREPYLFVHRPDNLDSPTIARRLYEAARAEVPELAALPVPVDPSGGSAPALF